MATSSDPDPNVPRLTPDDAALFLRAVTRQEHAARAIAEQAAWWARTTDDAAHARLATRNILLAGELAEFRAWLCETYREELAEALMEGPNTDDHRTTH